MLGVCLMVSLFKLGVTVLGFVKYFGLKCNNQTVHKQGD